MRQSILALAATASLALAADFNGKELHFFFPAGLEGANPNAEIISANPSGTTTARISCPTGVGPTECGWADGLDYTILAHTQYKASMVVEEDSTMTFDCTENASKTVKCGYFVGGPGAEFPLSTTMTWSGTDVFTATATVTKGASMLEQADGSSEKARVTTIVGTATGSTMQTSASNSGSDSPSGTPSATGSGSVPESTGAAYKFGVEASALVVLAGAAVLNAW